MNGDVQMTRMHIGMRFKALVRGYPGFGKPYLMSLLDEIIRIWADPEYGPECVEAIHQALPGRSHDGICLVLLLCACMLHTCYAAQWHHAHTQDCPSIHFQGNMLPHGFWGVSVTGHFLSRYVQGLVEARVSDHMM